MRPAAGANPYRPFELTAYAVWAGALLLAPLLPGALARAFAGATGTVSANAAATGAAVYLGLFPGALAYVAYTHALARLPVARATSFLYLVPVVAIPVPPDEAPAARLAERLDVEHQRARLVALVAELAAPDRQFVLPHLLLHLEGPDATAIGGVRRCLLSPGRELAT